MRRTIDWDGSAGGAVTIIDQTALPADYRVLRLRTVDELIDAIRRLAVRGAPALGAAGALGVVLAVREGGDPVAAAERVAKARPTAVNLSWESPGHCRNSTAARTPCWPKPCRSSTRTNA